MRDQLAFEILRKGGQSNIIIKSRCEQSSAFSISNATRWRPTASGRVPNPFILHSTRRGRDRVVTRTCKKVLITIKGFVALRKFFAPE